MVERWAKFKVFCRKFVQRYDSAMERKQMSWALVNFYQFHIRIKNRYVMFGAVPYILGELRDNTASVGWRTILGTWYTSYFFRNKIFLFVKIKSWNFQHLFDLRFRETFQNFSSFIQTWGVKVVWISWNFVRFHEMIIQRDAENFRFLSWQTKKSFIPKKDNKCYMYHG